MANDVAMTLARPDQILRAVGFSSAEHVERFLTGFGDALRDIPAVQRPQAVVFSLVPPSSTVPLPTKMAVRTLLERLANATHAASIVEADCEARVLSSKPLSAEVRRATSGGKWLLEQVCALSHSNPTGRCFVLATGLSVAVVAAGVPVIRYSDVTDKALESAAEVLQRQGWGDGELLALCGSEALGDRSRRGIWEEPDHLLLRRAPETLIQEIILDFLRIRLTGFSDLQREAHVPNEGRVDLLLTLADQRQYIVEVKWIGRSIKKDVVVDDEFRKRLAERWRCKDVMVLDEKNAHAGTVQLSFYVKKLRPTRAYLVAFDCRRPADRSTSKGPSGYPPAPDLSPAQYRVLHVAVDPRTASVKSK